TRLPRAENRQNEGSTHVDLALHICDRGSRLPLRCSDYDAAAGTANPARIAAFSSTSTWAAPNSSRNLGGPAQRLRVSIPRPSFSRFGRPDCPFAQIVVF